MDWVRCAWRTYHHGGGRASRDVPAWTGAKIGLKFQHFRGRKDCVSVTLGRHTNDFMTSFYCKTPSSFAHELAALGLLKALKQLGAVLVRHDK